MPTKKIAKNQSDRTKEVVAAKEAEISMVQRTKKRAVVWKQTAKKRTHDLLLRRPHRSFHRTRRRDYNRSLKMPGYWSFTSYVAQTFWRYKKLFIWLAVIYMFITIILVGIGSQSAYIQVSDTLRTTSGDIFKGGWGQIGQAGLLVVTGIVDGFNNTPNPMQQTYMTIIVLFTWLTTVWVLRAILAGHTPKLRDGLYNAGAPILPMFLVGFYLIIQLIPVAISFIAFGALIPYGVLDGGVETMLFWGVAALLTVLSLYWITSTLIALVVVTLPGMYPMQALKTAGDMVIGRRIRILFRFLWMSMIVVITWGIIMIPIVMFDTWLKGVFPAIQWLPLVPFALAMMMTLTVLWSASYIYLLYRRIIDDDAAPV